MASLSMLIDLCTRSILPPCPIYGMWGSRKTSCNGLAIEGGEGLYLPNRQTNLVIALGALPLLFCIFTNTTAYHLGRCEPSSPVSCRAPRPSQQKKLVKQFNYNATICYGICCQNIYCGDQHRVIKSNKTIQIGSQAAFFDDLIIKVYFNQARLKP